jgi:hypothetical protein
VAGGAGRAATWAGIIKTWTHRNGGGKTVVTPDTKNNMGLRPGAASVTSSKVEVCSFSCSLYIVLLALYKIKTKKMKFRA